jgi:hypothetical protein
MVAVLVDVDLRHPAAPTRQAFFAAAAVHIAERPVNPIL